MMSHTTQVHVRAKLFLGIGGWRVEVDGIPALWAPKQKRAVRLARRLYKTFPRAELYIHNRLGQIRERDTWPRSSDPPESPG